MLNTADYYNINPYGKTTLSVANKKRDKFGVEKEKETKLKNQERNKVKLNAYLENNNQKISVLRGEIDSLEKGFEEKLNKVRATWKKK